MMNQKAGERYVERGGRMTIRALWKEGKEELVHAGIQEAELDSRYLLEWALQKSYSFLLLNPDYEADSEAVQVYRQGIFQRKNHKPLQYITGEQEFMGFSFRVNPHVLIPRQDTEILVETVWKELKKRSGIEQKQYKMLDLCCGSGCIGLSIWKLLEQDRRLRLRESEIAEHAEAMDCWKVALSDISRAALTVAEENAKRLGAEVELIESDLFQAIPGAYDVIVSNPPYIPSRVVDTLMPEVREQEPRLALDGAEDGLYFYRKIMEQAKEHLKDEGCIFFEIGFNQAKDVRQILVDAGMEQIVVIQDLAGLDRVIYAGTGR
ncbi:MAG: peptide chain release factor N(5)-glutamine methyltransferase [Bacteroides sp.]|nr:peptide chain release factor N(5)-glutamine methyltransferase [Bacteroides sp.]MCM1549217.1 peptide chain release factor N(5)-glutamine methyltransferase [Clostridium sp.]